MAAYSRKMSGQYKLIEMGGPGDYLHYRCCCVLPNKISYTPKPLFSRLPKGICENECDLKNDVIWAKVIGKYSHTQYNLRITVKSIRFAKF